MFAAESTHSKIMQNSQRSRMSRLIRELYTSRLVTATSTSKTSKPLTKKAASTRNQPSSATPLTARAKARAREPSIDPAQAALDKQLTMSQFEPFAALAHRHTSAVKQLQAKAKKSKQNVRIGSSRALPGVFSSSHSSLCIVNGFPIG